MEIKTLKIRFWNQIEMLFSIIISLPIIIFFIYYFNFETGAILLFSGIYLLELLAVLYIHLTYYFYNKNMEIQIKNRSLYCYKNDKVSEHNFDQIDYIKIYADASVLTNFNFHVLPFLSYHYVFIKMKDGSKLYLTSLLDPKIFKVEDLFDKNKIQYESTKFAIIDTSE